jgi:hypothetical protein
LKLHDTSLNLPVWCLRLIDWKFQLLTRVTTVFVPLVCSFLLFICYCSLWSCLILLFITLFRCCSLLLGKLL